MTTLHRINTSLHPPVVMIHPGYYDQSSSTNTLERWRVPSLLAQGCEDHLLESGERASVLVDLASHHCPFPGIQ
jgi:hypothetical protein